MSYRLFFVRLFIINGFFVLLNGCVHNTSNYHDIIFGDSSSKVEVVDKIVTVSISEDKKAELGAQLYIPEKMIYPEIVFIMVPGSGFVSHKGKTLGDGFKSYKDPVEVTGLWSTALASRGFAVFAYDKRTCSSLHDDICRTNPVDDLNIEGPAALAKDIDAACEMVDNMWQTSRSKIVLFTYDQGGQVVLSSKCSKKASAIVIVSPILHGVDSLWAKIIKDASEDLPEEDSQARLLLNRSESLSATFESIKEGKFPEKAKVMGATVEFWKKWITLTEKTDDLIKKLDKPIVFVTGNQDLLVQKPIESIINAKKEDYSLRVFLLLSNTDHNMLTGGQLSKSTINTVVGNIVAVVG